VNKFTKKDLFPYKKASFLKNSSYFLDFAVLKYKSESKNID
jgi:hypothetical protein